MKTYTTRTSCRVCGSNNLTTLFSLGEQYVSDFVTEDNIKPTVNHTSKTHSFGMKEFTWLDNSGATLTIGYPATVPIDIELCNNCTLVQAKHTAPSDFLYSHHYWYKSGTTATMRDALRDVVIRAENEVNIGAGDVVLDIGANDGTLLSNYSNAYTRIGCEPAINLQEECRKHCDLLITDFWGEESYKQAWKSKRASLRFFRDPGTPKAKIITACGMFYDLEDPNQFIADVAKVLHPEGVFVAQLMCLKQTLEKKDVGNFAHEHLEFYSLRCLATLFEKHGLEIYDVEENDVNGGSYRLYARHKTANNWSEKLLQTVHQEDLRRFHDPAIYSTFFQELERNKATCVAFVKSAVQCGKSVWVYGASTKGNVILQYYGLDRTLIEAAIDRSPEKHGKYMIGSGIPIYYANRLADHITPPEYALVLPYAFLPEFMERESAWRANGGKFLVPLPEFKVV